MAMTISGTIGWPVLRSGMTVPQMIFWRCVVGSLTLFVACALSGSLRRHPTVRTLRWAAIGGFAIVANWLFIFSSFSRASIAVATVVYHTEPFMLIALGALVFGERLTTVSFAWIALSFIGVLLIADAPMNGRVIDSRYLLGVLFALAAAFFYAIAAIAAKKLAGVSPPLVALLQVLMGAIVLAPFHRARALPVDMRDVGTVVELGVVYTGVALVLLYTAIQRLSTATVGALSFLYPVVAICIDYAVFGHALTGQQILGAVAILASAAGSTLDWPSLGAGRAGPGDQPRRKHSSAAAASGTTSETGSTGS